MLDDDGLRYLVSAEALGLYATCLAWLRVWRSPDPDRLRLAALASAMLIVFRAISLSIGLIATAH